MQSLNLHSWNLTEDEARAQQRALRERVSLEDGFGEIKIVAGVDLAYSTERDESYAVVVILSWPECQVLEARYATGTPPMPYIPGLLSFRETPIALEALRQIERVPDVIFVDGQGQAHPRGFGIRCHLGVLLNTPTVGVAKSRLYGVYDTEALGSEAGREAPLREPRTGAVLGAVLRGKPRTNPLFISPGHKISVESATRLVWEGLRGYRLPEPTRQAHNLITAYRNAGAGREASSDA